MKIIQNILNRCDQINDAIQIIKSTALQNKQLLTLSEFCEYAGISTSYAYQLTGRRLIRHYKPKGKLIYIDRDDADDFIRQNEVETAPDYANHATRYIINHKK